MAEPTSTEARPTRAYVIHPDLGHARVDGDVASLVADAARVFEDMGARVTQVTPDWAKAGGASSPTTSTGRRV